VKRVIAATALIAGALLVAGSAGASGDAASVGVFPSATSFRAAAAPQAAPAAQVSLDMAIGGTDDAVVLVRGAKQVGAQLSLDAPLTAKLFLAHYVSFGGTLIPDALEQWDGGERSTEQLNQPLWIQVAVPSGTAAATYTGSIAVDADGTTTTIPIAVKVFPVALPAPNQVNGSLLTAFNVAGQSYSNKVASLYGPTGQASSPQLYSFMASYRISPNSWGYGTPHDASGYTTDRRWWMDSSGMMTAEVGSPRGFAAMALPLGNNRSAQPVAGLSPNEPQKWCSYLQAVHGFWQQHDWLGSYPYLYGMDEPGLAGFKIVAQQAAAAHRCFPGAKEIVTGNPSVDNRFLWNGGTDDVDAWVVLASRYYGKYTVPALTREGRSNATEKLKLIDQVRKRHAQIWTYNYAGTKTPSFTATEPLSDSRLLFDWAALENIGGMLYGQGTTTYSSGNPLQSVDRDGSFVLVYPGKDGPLPSARLEQIRDGIEDWEILNVVRRKHGSAAVGRILGAAGLFSTTKTGSTELGCTIGCQLKTTTAFSWPTWSSDASTPGRLEQMRLAALNAAS
jgi:Glycoside hydrolase 123, catalytic domain